MQADPQAVDDLFHTLAKELLLAWVQLAQERLAGTGMRCYITGGNDDYSGVLAVLPRGGDGPVRACEGEVVQLDAHHTMASLGISTPTPWHTPREVTEDELAVVIEKLLTSIPDAAKCIFNFHDPPNDSTLDTCPRLDWTTHPPSPHGRRCRGTTNRAFGAGPVSSESKSFWREQQMATATARPEVFTRKASGLVRVMSPYSAFVYNILTMGLIFPWTYLWAPGALPGGKLVWGILLATVLEIPIAFAYVWLSTALPRSGGDYVFQSRAFGGFWGFTLLMSGFVIWILQWVALSGWLLSYLGFAPLFLGLGATTGNAALSEVGVWFTSANGIIITSIVNAFLSMLLLVSGFKNYVKVQYVMFYGILVAFATTLIVLFTTPQAEFVTRLNEFAVRSGGVQNFYQAARDAVVGAGIDLNPPFSMLATLLVAPIAWTSLQWATYSAEQNGEIKEARSFKNQVFILVGSLIVTGILLALLAMAFERAGGTEFVYIAGAGYWSLIPEASISGFNLWPNILAVALTGSPPVVLLAALGS